MNTHNTFKDYQRIVENLLKNPSHFFEEYSKLSCEEFKNKFVTKQWTLFDILLRYAKDNGNVRWANLDMDEKTTREKNVQTCYDAMRLMKEKCPDIFDTYLLYQILKYSPSKYAYKKNHKVENIWVDIAKLTEDKALAYQALILLIEDYERNWNCKTRDKQLNVVKARSKFLSHCWSVTQYIDECIKKERVVWVKEWNNGHLCGTLDDPEYRVLSYLNARDKCEWERVFEGKPKEYKGVVEIDFDDSDIVLSKTETDDHCIVVLKLPKD